jgi:hypothetical protein
MKKTRILASILFAASALTVLSKTANPQLPQNGAVPDEQTAVKVAEAVLEPIYGDELMTTQRPLHARLEKGVWIVYGTVKPSHRGGAVMVTIRKNDGKILKIWQSV